MLFSALGIDINDALGIELEKVFLQQEYHKTINLPRKKKKQKRKELQKKWKNLQLKSFLLYSSEKWEI
jgi:hypothetical protein